MGVIFPESESLLQASWFSLLVSGKAAEGDLYAEGSQTAKSGTDEQERYRRLLREDEQAHFGYRSVHRIIVTSKVYQISF